MRAPIPDYTTADITLRTGNSKSGNKGNWDFAFSVRNLFNADAREPSMAPGLGLPQDIPLARRSLYVQASYHL